MEHAKNGVLERRRGLQGTKLAGAAGCALPGSVPGLRWARRRWRSRDRRWWASAATSRTGLPVVDLAIGDEDDIDRTVAGRGDADRSPQRLGHLGSAEVGFDLAYQFLQGPKAVLVDELQAFGNVFDAAAEAREAQDVAFVESIQKA